MKSNKPIILEIEEFEKKIVSMINSSGLPAYFVEPVIYKILIQVQNQKAQEAEKLTQEYQEKKEAN